MVYQLSTLIRICTEYIDKAQKIYSAFQFVQSGYSTNDFKAVNVQLRRLCRRYPGISFEICYSTINSKGLCEKNRLRTGKAGRPHTMMRGKKVPPHIHGIIIGVIDNCAIESFAAELKLYLRKKRLTSDNRIKQHKMGKIEHRYSVTAGVGFFSQYCHRQSTCIYHGGEEYDWDYFQDERFTTFDADEELF